MAADKANIEKLKAETAQHEAELQRDAAETQQRVAQAAANEAKARQLVAESEDLRSKDGQLTLASLLGLESVKRLPIVDNQHAIGAALDLQARERARFEHQGLGEGCGDQPRWQMARHRQLGHDGKDLGCRNRP